MDIFLITLLTLLYFIFLSYLWFSTPRVRRACPIYHCGPPSLPIDWIHITNRAEYSYYCWQFETRSFWVDRFWLDQRQQVDCNHVFRQTVPSLPPWSLCLVFGHATAGNQYVSKIPEGANHIQVEITNCNAFDGSPINWSCLAWTSLCL